MTSSNHLPGQHRARSLDILAMLVIGMLFPVLSFAQAVDTTSLEWHYKESDEWFDFDQLKASYHAQKAFHLLGPDRNDSVRFKVLWRLSNIYWMDGEAAKAIQLQRKALANASAAHREKDIASALDQLGMNYFFIADYDSAIYYFKSAEKLCEKSKDTLGLAKALNHQGLVYDIQANFTAAVDLLNQSLKLQHSNPNFFQLSYGLSVSNMIGDSIYYKRKLDQEINSLPLIDAEPLWFHKGKLLWTIGQDYFFIRDFRRSISYHKQSLRVFKEAGRRILWWEDLANAYGELGQYDSAIYYASLRSLQPQSRSARITLCRSFLVLGKIYQSAGRLKEAKKSLTDGIALARSVHGQLKLIQMLQLMANIELQQHHYPEADRLVSESIGVAEKIKAEIELRDGYQLKSEVLKRLGNEKEALRWLEKYVIKDSILSNSQLRYQVASLQLWYENERKESELRQLTAESKLKDQDLLEQQLKSSWYLAAGLLFFVIACLIFFIYLKIRNQKRVVQRNAALLAQSAAEKEVLLHEVHHRVKNNLQIISSLISLRSLKTVTPTEKEYLVDLSNKINVMGLVHDMLYNHDRIEKVNMRDYLQDLSGKISSALEHTGVTEFIIDNPLELSLDMAMAFGLIHNELVTNAIKYARPDGNLIIKAGVRMDGSPDRFVYFLKDNGMQSIKIEPSFGLRFVQQIVNEKIGGEMKFLTDKGFSVEIYFTV